jgi:hypothetical protein
VGHIVDGLLTASASSLGALFLLGGKTGVRWTTDARGNTAVACSWAIVRDARAPAAAA